MAKQDLYSQEVSAIARLLSDWPPLVVDQLFDEMLTLWGVPEMREHFHWRWNARLRTTLGRAIFDDWTVELNPLLLARHADEMRGLLVHELAHLVIVRRYGFKEPAHGPRWKALMSAAGESTRATHDLPVEDLRQPRRRRRRRVAGLRWRLR